MTPRAVIPESDVRPSVQVTRVCALLDCEPSQVYRMIAAGELEAHGMGVRGVRVYLAAVAAYQQRHEIAPRSKAARRRLKPAPAVSPASRRAHEQAVASLRQDGVLS